MDISGRRIPSSSFRPPPGPVYTCLDSQLELWSACAGDLTQIPQVNSTVCYFAQGHAEHSSNAEIALNTLSERKIPSLLFCTVESVNFLAERHTDEVVMKMKLRGQFRNEQPPENVDSGIINASGPCVRKAYILFLSQEKKLPIKEAEATILFPEVSEGQKVRCSDVHGVIWEFKLTYERRRGGLRGPPVLTNGWAEFVSEKRLKAKDLIIFMRDKNGALRIGIRHWMIRKCSLEPHQVADAAELAFKFKPFEVLFYPRASTPEFVIKLGYFECAKSVPWKVGSRFMMSYEEDEYSYEVSPYKQVDYGQGSNTCEGAVLSSVPFDSRWPVSSWRSLSVSVPALKRLMKVSPWVLTFLNNPEVPKLEVPTKAD